MDRASAQPLTAPVSIVGSMEVDDGREPWSNPLSIDGRGDVEEGGGTDAPPDRSNDWSTRLALEREDIVFGFSTEERSGGKSGKASSDKGSRPGQWTRASRESARGYADVPDFEFDRLKEADETLRAGGLKDVSLMFAISGISIQMP